MAQHMRMVQISEEEDSFTYVPETRPVQSKTRPLTICVAVGVAALTVGVGVFSSSTSQPQKQETTDGVELAVISNVARAQGCANWADINLGGLAAVQSDLACETWCKNSPSCTGFNFVPADHCNGEGGPTGACYRWGSTPCETETNDCWDNYKLMSQVPAAWGPPDPGKGCENWNSILLRSEMGVANAEACGILCAATTGCVDFGFQVKECGAPMGAAKGACYLYHGACQKADNDCWDHYVAKPNPTVPGPWQLTRHQVGCSNWETIKIGDPTLQVSKDACGWLCNVVQGCVGFGYQTGLSSDSSPNECGPEGTPGGLYPGACYLWSGRCDHERNPCWDDYTMPSLEEYCPKSRELRIDYDALNPPPGEPSGSVKLSDQGWEITGGARVSTRGVWDMLGGWISFEMDLSKSIIGLQQGSDQGPNANLYTIFPQTGSGDYDGRPRTIAGLQSQYCDGQGQPEGHKTRSELVPNTLCAELDIIEANSQYAFSTTWHTSYTFKGEGDPNNFPPPDQCNQNGCKATRFFELGGVHCTKKDNSNVVPVGIDASQPFRVNTTFAVDGSMTVTYSQDQAVVVIDKDSADLYPSISPETLNAIVGNMTQFGAAVESSQYNGFVPAASDTSSNYKCAAGQDELSQSIFSIKNLRIKGVKMRGSASLCSTSS